ncbi:hypothetical protein X275_08530 [Marinitoga sp. 1197]|uniref:diguanylate cyclase n=1 Tax=Marinitoga sp. 1197 TaxID=1428449 RepID=UPI000659FBE3|nr:diguanylate cyclase [Marinitoga sp. 1197]KLO21643.1 hypothetical protein X275_08530 [Marinitoga sp. 1197]
MKTKTFNLIIVLLLILGLLIISVNSLFQMNNDKKLLNNMKNSISLIKNISSAVFHLQNERGLVNMYVNGEKSVYDELVKERNLFNKYLENIKNLNLEDFYYKKLEDIEKKLNLLRKNIGKDNNIDIFINYTTIINDLLDFYNYSIKQKTVSETGKWLSSIYFLERIKEYSGEFRGIFSAIIYKKMKISEKEYYLLDRSFYSLNEFPKFKGLSFTKDTYEKLNKFYTFEGYKNLWNYYELFEKKSPKLYELNSKDVFKNLSMLVNYFQNIINYELSSLDSNISSILKEKITFLFIDTFTLFFSIIMAIFIIINYYKLIKVKDELGKNLSLFQTIFENSPVGIIIFNTNLKVIMANPSSLNVLNLKKNDIIEFDLSTLSNKIIKDNIFNVLKDKISYYEGEYTSYISGKKIILRAKFAPLKKDNYIIGGIIIMEDYTERNNLEKKLKHLATHDILTELPNRTLFFENVKNILAIAKRNNLKYALMFIDIDNFKKVNDNFGHDKGDEILIEFSNILRNSLRNSDLISRFGGDEFVVLVQYKELKDIHTITKKMSEKIYRKFSTNKCSFSISLSIGVSLFPEHSENIDTLIKYADMAMYKAKKIKNTVIIYKKPH